MSGRHIGERFPVTRRTSRRSHETFLRRPTATRTAHCARSRAKL
jgi:hypothetical protein